MSSMDLSICVLTHSQPELLPKCVASCFSEIEKAGISGEVIVIDNASTDGSPQGVAQRFPRVRILRNEKNLGFSAANNRAIRASTGRYILILNDDAILQEGSLQLLLQKLESDTRIGAVGPRLLNPDGSLQFGFTNRRFPNLRGVFCPLLHMERLLEKNHLTRDWFTLNKDLTHSAEAQQLAGACLLLRRNALESINGFDEGFYFIFEDTDLCYRLIKAGWKNFYVSEADVIHYGSASFNKLSRSEKGPMFYRSLLFFFEKHTSRIRFWTLRLGLALIFSLRVIVAGFLALVRINRQAQERNELVLCSVRILHVVLRGVS